LFFVFVWLDHKFAKKYFITVYTKKS